MLQIFFINIVPNISLFHITALKFLLVTVVVVVVVAVVGRYFISKIPHTAQATLLQCYFFTTMNLMDLVFSCFVICSL